jgi:hypothetical protein
MAQSVILSANRVPPCPNQYRSVHGVTHGSVRQKSQSLCRAPFDHHLSLCTHRLQPLIHLLTVIITTLLFLFSLLHYRNQNLSPHSRLGSVHCSALLDSSHSAQTSPSSAANLFCSPAPGHRPARLLDVTYGGMILAVVSPARPPPLSILPWRAAASCTSHRSPTPVPSPVCHFVFKCCGFLTLLVLHLP